MTGSMPANQLGVRCLLPVCRTRGRLGMILLNRGKVSCQSARCQLAAFT